ncbi:hypothetical protein C8Q80DRAFT_1273008 [Daedaleopsis nitida]|nr:hypothetical protein C8Q80DRAFT_1273008 [Daedaleopsis nitida]
MANLRVLRLRMDTRDPWRDLASALQQLPGTHLEELVLSEVRVTYQYTETSEVTISGHPTVHIHGDGLELLQPVILEEKFKELQVVDFCSFTHDDDKWVNYDFYSSLALKLHRKMPKLSSSGLLQVEEEPTKDYGHVQNAIADDLRDARLRAQDGRQESDAPQVTEQNAQPSSSSLTE